MRKIRLSGREMQLIRAIGFGMGATGKDLLEATSYDENDLVDMLNGMMNVGFLTTVPYLLEITQKDLLETQFEVNSGYAHELRKAMVFRF